MAITTKPMPGSEMIHVDLSGPDGNAFALMGYAKRFAKQLEWEDGGSALINEMMEGDYD